MNVTVLQGHLTRPPERRVLPSGDELVHYEVTVPGDGDGRAESVPVVWPDAPAAAVAMDPDTEVVVVGRVRRRFFRTGGATRSSTEVVAQQVVPARYAKRARRAVLSAIRAVEEAAG